MAKDSRLTLIGGGLGGALLATYLGRAGYEVDLYERRPDPAAGNLVGGRSINLAVSTRGLFALHEVGLEDEILKLAVPMRGRMIHGPAGDLHFQPYDKDPARHINSVSRAGLNAALIDAARRNSRVRVHFSWRCVDVDLQTARAEVLNEETGQRSHTGGDVLIGIDGAFSAVRRSFPRLDRFDYSQHYLGHGYKELTIPPTPAGDFAIEPNALHIWPRRSFMMIALPNPDRSFTCTLFYPFAGPASFETLKTEADVQSFFERNFPDALPLMPTLLADFAHNPVGAMVTVRCSPWSYRDKVTLVGDAAHAVVPFYGQGANAAFEDCTILNQCVQRHAPDWGHVFAEYERERKENVDALADLAIGNFIEMRDHTGSRLFRAYKKMERTLHRGLPRWYTPLYTMVSFTRTPYAQAVRRARRQNRVLAAIAALLAVALLTLLLHANGEGSLIADLTTAALLVSLAAQLAGGRLRGNAREMRQSGAELLTR